MNSSPVLNDTLNAGWHNSPLALTSQLLVLLFMVIFTRLRLMSAAHWVTDEIVGALSLGLIILGRLFKRPGFS